MPVTQSGLNMAVNSSGQPLGNPTLVRKNLKAAIKLYEDQPKLTFYEKICGTILTTEQAYEEFAQVSGIDMPSIVPEYGTVPWSDVYVPYTKRTLPIKRMLQFRISDEAFINDRYGIVKSYGIMLKGAFRQYKETAAGVFLNSCTSSGVISTPAGQPLSSASHPLDPNAGSVTTDSNTFTTQQLLGVIAIEDATMMLRNQKAHKGYPFPKLPPFVLEVAPRNGQVAKRLVGSENLPGGDANDKNVVRGDIQDVVVSPYFVNPEWWSIRCIDKTQQHRFLLERYGFKLTQGGEYDPNTDSWNFTAKENYAFDVTDYRGVIYSTPA